MGSTTIRLFGKTLRAAQDLYNDVNLAGTSDYWVGLAINYLEAATLTLSDCTLTDPLGSGPWNDGLFQELNQSIIGKLDYGDTYVPGS